MSEEVMRADDFASWASQRVKAILASPRGHVDELIHVLTKCSEQSVLHALGCKDWLEGLALLLDRGLGDVLERSEREKLTEYLYVHGLSSRTISRLLNVSHTTVLRDRSKFSTDVKESTVVGSDGKRYPTIQSGASVPIVARRGRPPITRVVASAVFDLSKVMRRLEKVLGDERFDANSSQLILHRAELQQAVLTISQLLGHLSSPRETGENDE